MRVLIEAESFIKAQKASTFISGVIEKELKAKGKFDDTPTHKFGGSQLEKERFFWWALVNDALTTYSDIMDDKGKEAAEKRFAEFVSGYKKHHSADEAKNLERWLRMAIKKLETL